MELELATAEDIFNELRNRHYGHFVFYKPEFGLIAGKQMTPDELDIIADQLHEIAERDRLNGA